jgi:hypothetical protein
VIEICNGANDMLKLEEVVGKVLQEEIGKNLLKDAKIINPCFLEVVRETKLTISSVRKLQIL